MRRKRIYISRTCLRLCLVASVVALIAISCNKQEASPPPQTAAASEPSAAAQPTTSAPTEVAAATEAATASQTQSIIVKDVGFMTPESVLYDDKNDVYLVSNINGTPDGKDNNGFISRIGPDGAVIALKWVEGGQNKTELNAPKGMAFREDTLFVADIDCIRMFDRATGVQKGKIDIKGASFLNDLSTAPNGTLYASDSGMKSSKDGLIASGKDAIYKIDAKNKVKKLISGKDLHQPNGILAEDGGVLVVTMSGNEMYRVSDKGKQEIPTMLPSGTLDGVVKMKDGDILVSSWESSTVYRGGKDGKFVAAFSELRSPADIGYDPGRDRLLVPMFSDNAIHITPMSEQHPAAIAQKESTSSSKEAVASSTGTAPSSTGTAASSKSGGLKSNAPEPETAASKEDKATGPAANPASSKEGNATKPSSASSSPSGAGQPAVESKSSSQPKK